MRYADDEAHQHVIAQMRALVREATELLREGAGKESCAPADEAIVVATGLDPAVVPRLSAGALTSLMEMAEHDDRVIELLAQALEIEAQVSSRSGDIVKAGLRADQASAMRRMLDPKRAN